MEKYLFYSHRQIHLVKLVITYSILRQTRFSSVSVNSIRMKSVLAVAAHCCYSLSLKFQKFRSTPGNFCVFIQYECTSATNFEHSQDLLWFMHFLEIEPHALLRFLHFTDNSVLISIYCNKREQERTNLTLNH